MAWRGRTMFLSGLASSVLTLGLQAQGPSVPAGAVAAATVAHTPDHFAGLWVYNPDQSVNAATGRPERAPRNAAQRAPVGRPGAPPVVASSVRTDDYPGNRGLGAFGSTAGPIGPTVAMIQENRSLTRDLLEVAEAFTIKLAPGAVTFVDDLQRARTYETSGLRERQQIGAARFHAATNWNGSQLEKRIDAADGFRMTEVYFLSADARRLFVIVRVGSTRKGAPIMGVNRVYDRVDQ